MALLMTRCSRVPCICARIRNCGHKAVSRREPTPGGSRRETVVHEMAPQVQCTTPQPSAGTPPMAREPILIVDDNAHNLKLVRVILAAEQYEVKTAADAEQALMILESFAPQLILMDLQLPGMDGLELTRQLRTDPSRRQIIIIALTAYAMKGDEERALSAGCDGYMSKPIEIDALIKMVAAQLARHRDLVVGR
jgi:CheY-like chemotaxis protein